MMDWEGWVTYMRDALAKWADEEFARHGTDDRYANGYVNGLRDASRLLTQILRHAACIQDARDAIERAVRDARES